MISLRLSGRGCHLRRSSAALGALLIARLCSRLPGIPATTKALVPDMFGVYCASRTLCWAVGGSWLGTDTVSTMAIMMSTSVREQAAGIHHVSPLAAHKTALLRPFASCLLLTAASSLGSRRGPAAGPTPSARPTSPPPPPSPPTLARAESTSLRAPSPALVSRQPRSTLTPRPLRFVSGRRRCPSSGFGVIASISCQ